jgi:hypothetical protein
VITFTQQERDLMDEAAASIVKRRLAVPAMMLLETMTPMNMVSASMLHVLSPVWRAALPASRIEDIAKLLERREAIPEFVKVIDAAEEARRKDAKERRNERRGPRSTRDAKSEGSEN